MGLKFLALGLDERGVVGSFGKWAFGSWANPHFGTKGVEMLLVKSKKQLYTFHDMSKGGGGILVFIKANANSFGDGVEEQGNKNGFSRARGSGNTGKEEGHTGIELEGIFIRFDLDGKETGGKITFSKGR
jgi:hypothetical protein